MMKDMTKNKIDIKKVKKWAEENILCVLNALHIEYIDKGKYIVGSCPVPYHKGDATNKSAFNWSCEKNLWACWTHKCHEDTSADIFGLVMSMNETSFGSALYYLFELMNNPNTLSIPRVKTFSQPYDFKDNSSINLSKLDLLYEDEYFSTQRGISKEILNKHRVGFWQKPGSYMHKRAIVPLFNDSDELVGFSGRDIFGDSNQKWIHGKDFVYYSNETFHKSLILYNFNNVKKLLPRPTEIYIVEGPIDLWKLEMAGIYNVVATLGLGITFTQISKLIELGIKTLYICYDNDEKTKAGEKAALSIKNSLSELFDVEIRIPKTKNYSNMDIEEICKNLSIK